MEKLPPHPLSAQDILEIWETGARQHLLDRGLTILLAGYPPLSWPALADLSIGQRDGLLLELCASTFGSRLSAQASCPACQHVLEFGLDASALHLGSGESESGRFEVQVPDGPTIEFRLPTSRDLASLVTSQPADGTRYLAQRCVLQIRQQGETLELDRTELPDGWLQALNAGLSAHDPQAGLELEFTCPVCAHNWQRPGIAHTEYRSGADQHFRQRLRPAEPCCGLIIEVHHQPDSFDQIRRSL